MDAAPGLYIIGNVHPLARLLLEPAVLVVQPQDATNHERPGLEPGQVLERGIQVAADLRAALCVLAVESRFSTS